MGGCSFFMSIIYHILGLIAIAFYLLICLALFPQLNIFLVFNIICLLISYLYYSLLIQKLIDY